MDIVFYTEFESSMPMGFCARGHVDKDKFSKAIEDLYGYKANPEKIQHGYRRNLPDGSALFMLNPANKRGCYLVTNIDYSHCEAIMK